jgi:hypothetical protein
VSSIASKLGRHQRRAQREQAARETARKLRVLVSSLESDQDGVTDNDLMLEDLREVQRTAVRAVRGAL